MSTFAGARQAGAVCGVAVGAQGEEQGRYRCHSFVHINITSVKISHQSSSRGYLEVESRTSSF